MIGSLHSFSLATFQGLNSHTWPVAAPGTAQLRRRPGKMNPSSWGSQASTYFQAGVRLSFHLLAAPVHLLNSLFLAA